MVLDWFSFGFEDQLRDDFKGKLTIDRSLIRTFDYYADRHNYYPAMLIPSRAKDELAFPAQHYFSLTSYMHQVDTLCIVGWKGKTFQSFVTKERRKTSKIGNCRPQPEIVLKNLEQLIDTKKLSVTTYMGFAEFVNEYDFQSA